MTGPQESNISSPGKSINWLTAEFRDAGFERQYREFDAPAHRRHVLALCLISLILAVLVQTIIGGQQQEIPILLKLARVGHALNIVFMLTACLRRFHYRWLDASVAILAILVVWQSLLLEDVAEPDKLGLLIRNVFLIALAYLLLPTRFLFYSATVLAQSIICLYQVLTFFHIDRTEQLSVFALVSGLVLATIYIRWQRDITSRRRFLLTQQRDESLAQLSESESKLRLVTDHLPIFVAYIDNQMCLQYANETGRDWYQLHGVDIVGRKLQELIPRDYRSIEPFAEAALKGEVVHFERVVDCPDGKTRTVAVTHLPHLSANKAVLGYFSQMVDMTEIKQSELDLKNASREAEASNQSKSEFMANMSHELRTPLNAVIGFSSAMASGLAGELQGKQSEYITDIQNSGEHLLSLINDLLDLSKIEAGKLEIYPEQVEADDQIERCLPFVKEQAGVGQVRLRHTPSPDLPELSVDPRMLRQMIVNLLSNAVKFSPEKGTVSCLAMQDSAGRITINIRDEGPGMSAEDIPKALTPFVQTESGMKAGGGTGLGLSLVKEMMALHGGTLEIQSVVGHGTTASLCFPAKPKTIAVE
ncbi:MAG: PAS domain-containing protein [Alphaproteobacteria bacterium]|nr:PAS domain-containing protein [Alphaproteobacteria bacterium]MBT4019820.1 PAS domain-containing protein [Alphaproteobacteria bacterium]MBT4966185.1 PAS domain-containing protein [Alphaproteobacteria bacterium]MBT5158622.1 PAS domain-containing protein [Alphaproteobacteria bacterium]MBT5917640.1 PAS domain-containing protein [Alphaproteobacteria bacterium]